MAPCIDYSRHSIAQAVRQPISLLAIAPGPTRIEMSSASLAWRGFLLEKHFTSPGVRTSAFSERHVITMLCASSSRFEYCDPQGNFVSCVNRAGTITITPSGPVPDLRLFTPSELLHCALDEGFLNGVAAEMDRQPALQPEFRASLQDGAIQRILSMMLEELIAERPFGRLYVDSLAHALATRYLLLERQSVVVSESRVSGLPARILKRIREKIEANLEADLTLESLAEESGYSRAHFLRMFRVATGLTPHQYVLELRLTRAQDCLRQMNASIIDIAESCGFSSQSHMTSVFRQRLEMTPGEFRRSVRTECVA
jgi:AraC family transcriptional regulator